MAILKYIPYMVQTFTLSIFCVLNIFNDALALQENQNITIGSKAFPESHLLAEIAAQLLEQQGFQVQRKFGLGGTLIAYQSLKENDIQLYPEYTGTILQTILKRPSLSFADMQKALRQQQLRVLKPLGFNNSYALVTTSHLATQLNLKTIDDLSAHPSLEVNLSLEFLNREDGWRKLKSYYKLPLQAKGIEHTLAYNALLAQQIDVTDAYTTDGKLAEYPLTTLQDNRNFFPDYHALFLAQANLPEKVVTLLNQLENSLSNASMQELNRLHNLPDQTASSVAQSFLLDQGLITSTSDLSRDVWKSIQGHIAQHLILTFSALVSACLFAIPLALFIANQPRIARFVVYTTGLLQTIPSLALLALLIPLFGLGQFTAIVALFLYSLLPIVRNTISGIESVDPLLKQVARGIGLTPLQQLIKIDLPLAMPAILAGIKTAAIISLGTATLAAFVGAGGLGEPIITGLTLNDQSLILEGAIPVAVLAILTELLFEAVEKYLVPVHLKH